MSWDDIIEIAKKNYGLKRIIWYNDPSTKQSGSCTYDEGIININSSNVDTDQRRFKILFHELGHIHCYNNGIWKKYHTRLNTKEARRGIVLTGLKAERWIDKWAENEIKKYIPDFVYEGSYKNKETVKLYKETYLNQFK